MLAQSHISCSNGLSCVAFFLRSYPTEKPAWGTPMTQRLLVSDDYEKAGLHPLSKIAGIHATWSAADIAAYMKMQAARYPGNWSWRFDNFVFSQRWLTQSIRLFALFLTMVGVFGTLGFSIHTVALVLSGSAASKIIGTALLAILSFGLTFGVTWFTYRRKVIGPAAWITIKPWQFGGILPHKAARLMSAFYRLDPTTAFEISDLRRPGPEKTSLDPVLWAIRGDERLAVLVWNPDGSIVEPPPPT